MVGSPTFIFFQIKRGIDQRTRYKFSFTRQFPTFEWKNTRMNLIFDLSLSIVCMVSVCLVGTPFFGLMVFGLLMHYIGKLTLTY